MRASVLCARRPRQVTGGAQTADGLAWTKVPESRVPPAAGPACAPEVEVPSWKARSRIMKTTVDIPVELEDAIRFTNARTKREAVVGTIVDFNRRSAGARLNWQDMLEPATTS